jgi:hypothetical protein
MVEGKKGNDTNPEYLEVKVTARKKSRYSGLAQIPDEQSLFYVGEIRFCNVELEYQMKRFSNSWDLNNVSGLKVRKAGCTDPIPLTGDAFDLFRTMTLQASLDYDKGLAENPFAVQFMTGKMDSVAAAYSHTQTVTFSIKRTPEMQESEKFLEAIAKDASDDPQRT